MGYHTEINTLLKVPADFDTGSLRPGQTYEITRERERVFPLHIAVLLVDADWNFYGYCVVDEISVGAEQTKLKFTVLSLFNESQHEIYKHNFLDAAEQTGEIK